MSTTPDTLSFTQSASGSLMHQLQTARQEVEQRDTQIGDLIQVVNKAVREAAESKAAAAAREVRLQALSEQVKEFEAIKREWREFKDENDRMQGELAKSRLRGAELRLEVDQLRTSRQNLAKEIGSLNGIVTELKVALRNKYVLMGAMDNGEEGSPPRDANDVAPELPVADGGEEAGVCPAPMRALIAQDDGHEEYPLTEPSIVIGRASDCDIRVGCSRASRRHARLVSNETGTTIEDLGSVNGVSVNEVKVRSQRLRDGDIVRIGKNRFRFRDAAA
jgi:chromosome segregation ATPase